MIIIIGSYSNEDGDSNENGKNAIALIYGVGKLTTLQVHHTYMYLYISLLFLISRTLMT